MLLFQVVRESDSFDSFHSSEVDILRLRSSDEFDLLVVQTYGPFIRCYEHTHWKSLSAEQRSKLLARQGFSFVTAQDTRVVHQLESDDLIDVPRDGKTIGEVVVRGNIVMNEVSNMSFQSIPCWTVSLTVLQRSRRDQESVPRGCVQIRRSGSDAS